MLFQDEDEDEDMDEEDDNDDSDFMNSHGRILIPCPIF